MLTIDPARLEASPGQWVLDAGCGQGRHSVALQALGCHAVALDLNPDDLRYTRYLLHNQRKESGTEDNPLAEPVLRASAEDLPFANGTFHHVMCSEVLEHVPNPQRALQELTRVLKPGGTLALSVPTPFTEAVYRLSSDEYFNSPGGHVRILTPGRLREMLRQCGHAPVDIHFEHSFHSVYWWVRCVFGLHDEAHPAIRNFRKMLTHVLFSPLLQRAEHTADWFFPKSMVLYSRAVEG